MKALGLGVTLLAIALSARSPNRSGPLGTAAASQKIITLRFSGWQSNPNEGKLLSQLLREFEAKYPTIKVKYEAINSEYMDVMRTRLIGDVAPDVFYLEAFEAPKLMKAGVLEPLEAYITSDYHLDDFQPSLLQAFKSNGKLYGIPKDFSTLALFYNRRSLSKAGITSPPQTWEELLTVSKRLTVSKPRGDIQQYGFGLAPELARQQFMIQAYGGKLVNQYGYAAFATPQGEQGLALVVDQYRRDRTAAQPTDVGATWGSEMLGQEKAAMVIEGPWSIPYFKETFPNLSYGTAEVPTVNGKRGTMAFTVAYVMNRQSKHKQATWTLIRYLTDKQGMKAWAKQGMALPSRRSLLTELGYNQNPLYAPFVRGSAYATIWQGGENLPTIRTNFNNQFVSALLGEQPLSQAMKRAQETANREIYLSN
jgi:multiple sugar transport system substrate-binding protein